MTHSRQPRETHTDDSTLFSLQALVREKPLGKPRASAEDSGLIDLAALGSAPASDPIAEAPDLFGPPVQAAPRPEPAGPPPVPRRDRYIAAVLWAAVVLLSAAIAGKLYPSSSSATVAAPPPTEPAVEAPAPAAVEPKVTATSTEPSPADGPELIPKPVAAPRPAAPPTPTRPVVERKVPPTPKTAPPATEAPKTPGCICPPEDLTCHMRCATAG